MKKLSLILTSLAITSVFCQEAKLIHNLSSSTSIDKSLDESSPYSILQDALRKKKIHLQSINQEAKQLFAVDRIKLDLHQKVLKMITGKQQQIHFSEDPNDILVFWNIPDEISLKSLKKIPSDRLVLFTFKAPTSESKEYSPKIKQIFSKIYTWDDSIVDDKKFFKCFYPGLKSILSNLPSFKDRKLCTLIADNVQDQQNNPSLIARKSFIKTIESVCPEKFEFYGKNWDGQNHNSYAGDCADELSTLSQYKFSLCYEDAINTHGFISEKIFQSFSAGCIPIYLGASNITDYIPKQCFIDRRDFTSDEKLLEHINQMTEESYNGYVNNIRAFIQSKEAKVFSLEHFTKTVQEAVKN